VAPPYTDLLLSSFLQGLPLMRVDRSCFSEILHGVLTGAACNEQQNALSDLTNIGFYNSLEFNFVEERQEMVSDIGRYSNLTMEFEHYAEHSDPSLWVSEAVAMVSDLAKGVPATELAYSLLTKLRQFDGEQLQELILQSSGKHWDPAISMILKLGTDASNDILRRMRSEIDISPMELRGILTHLTREYALRHSLAIIDHVPWGSSSDGMRKAMRRYCRHNTSCWSDEDLNRSYKKLVPTIRCSNPYEDFLRELTQLGYLGNEKFVEEFSPCLTDKDWEIHYRSLEVLRNTACETFDYRKLLEVSKSSENWSYLGTLRYLTLTRCPTDGFKEFLYNKLKLEDVNEQTSFIWSHLSNSNEILAKEIVADLSLKSKYVSSALRFSRNFHRKFEFRNVSYIVDMNLILSNENLIPKYVSLMLTGDLGFSSIFDIQVHQHKHGYYVLDMELLEQFEFTKKFDEYDVKDVLDYVLSPISNILKGLLGRVRMGYTVRELFLSYRTAIGMPLHFKSNITTYNEPERHLARGTVHANFQATVDTPHTTVGRGMEIAAQFNAFVSAYKTRSGKSRNMHFTLNLPLIRNSIIGFNFSQFKVKNGSTKHYFDANDVSHSFCLPWLDHVVGINMCLTPYVSYHERHSFSSVYSVDFIRARTVRGLDISLSHSRTGSERRITILGDNVSDEELYLKMYHFNELHAIKFETPVFGIEMQGSKLNEMGYPISMRGVMRIGDIEGDFTLEGMSFRLDHFDYYFNSTLWGSVKLHSWHEQVDEEYMYTLMIPYNLHVLKLSDSIKFNAKYGKKSSRYQICSELELPMIDSFNFETKCFLEFRNFFETVMLGAELNISLPLNKLETKSDFAFSKKLLDHETLVLFRHDGVNTEIVSKDSVKMKDKMFEYIGKLLVNNEVLFDVRSSYSQPSEVPFKMSYQCRVPPRHNSAPPFELTATSELDLSSSSLQTSVSTSLKGHENNLELYFGREFVDEDGNGRQAGLSVSCDGRTALEVASSWQLAPPSDFGVNASLRLQDAPVEALSLQVKKRGPHVALTLTEFEGDLEQTYALEGVLGD